MHTSHLGTEVIRCISYFKITKRVNAINFNKLPRTFQVGCKRYKRIALALLLQNAPIVWEKNMMLVVFFIFVKFLEIT